MICLVAWWLRGLGDGHWPQVWDRPKIPPRSSPVCAETFTGYPTAKSTCRLNISYKLSRVPVKWLLLNNHTSLGRLGSAALVGSQSRRRTTPIRNLRVPSFRAVGWSFGPIREGRCSCPPRVSQVWVK